ncbi:hypothetical protein GOP47_0001646 [Adiantum capillus-veneris]|uniref:Peptide N-acetyl-beta-D-glucosaminyl asparaginase amidase A N-terminal domain-containing protein n=1 Tax=Adiantum capillus-veneris TaxID=13818 RepID=A0A9D4VA38_ADICA|nr:hypothetical protein GOP47_0001646 [Adiantum capillus-veneris]
MVLAACFIILIVVAVEAVDNQVSYPINVHGWVFGHHPHVTHPQADGDTSTSSKTTFFEVNRPIDLPAGSKLLCSTPILNRHVFGDTGDAAPATSQFATCTAGATFDRVVLRWQGSCTGRQFGRISTVWVSGVEVVRTCTPEFPDGGGSWAFSKDVTRFTSLFKTVRKVSVELGNVPDVDYNGVYNISIFLDFYQTGLKRQYASPDLSTAPAHKIKAIALPNPKSGGYWFRLGGSDNPQSISKEVTGLPRNAYRAVLELCVSSHGDDESWFTNPPNDYADSTNLTFGNGPFREISVSIDNKFVGSVWPFPLVYTGGFNPLAWRPALPIGTSLVPSYDLEITPFLSYLIDGSPHTITLTVTNSLSVWLIDANLHLWVDSKGTTTFSSLLNYNAPYYAPSINSKFSGLDGQFVVSADRNYSFSGWVLSSQGNVTICVTSSFTYNNTVLLEDNYGYQTANLLITSQRQIVTSNDTAILATYKTTTEFPFGITCTQRDGPNDSTYLKCSIAHGMSSDEFAIYAKGNFARSISNIQTAAGELNVASDNTVSGGTGSLHQQYDYKGTKGCYKRLLSTQDSTILADSSSSICTPCNS